jgi:hypothetical protein
MYGNKLHAFGRIKRNEEKNRCLRMGFSTRMEAYLMSSSLAAASTAAATSAMILKYITPLKMPRENSYLKQKKLPRSESNVTKSVQKTKISHLSND